MRVIGEVDRPTGRHLEALIERELAHRREHWSWTWPGWPRPARPQLGILCRPTTAAAARGTELAVACRCRDDVVRQLRITGSERLSVADRS